MNDQIERFIAGDFYGRLIRKVIKFNEIEFGRWNFPNWKWKVGSMPWS